MRQDVPRNEQEEQNKAKELWAAINDEIWEAMSQPRPIIYAVMYNPMVHESTWGLISLHKSLKGAEITLSHHKHNTEKEEGAEYCGSMDWRIQKYDLFE